MALTLSKNAKKTSNSFYATLNYQHTRNTWVCRAQSYSNLTLLKLVAEIINLQSKKKRWFLPTKVHSWINDWTFFDYLKSPECMKLLYFTECLEKNHFFLILCINLHQLECTVSFCKAHVTTFAFMSCSTGFVSFLLLQYTAPWIVTLETFHLTELALNVLLPFRFQAAVK